jgi:hypothetical protein
MDGGGGLKMEIKKETLVRISRNEVFNLIEEALDIKLDREQTRLSFHGVKGILKEEKNKNKCKDKRKVRVDLEKLNGKMVWVIKFKDGEDIYHYREEIYNDKGEFEDYGLIKTFKTKKEAQAFIDTLDSREFERWAEEVI